MVLYGGAEQGRVGSGSGIGKKEGITDFRVADGKSSIYGNDAELTMRRDTVVG